MFGSEGAVIGLKKIAKYKEIIRKMTNNEQLTAEEKAFLKGAVTHN